jgi:rod shape-determining protein MreD
MSGRAGLRMALVMLVTISLQAGLLSGITISHVHPEIIWLVPAAAGLVAGPGTGAVTGFAIGLWLDCLLPTPFGLSALVGTIIGYLAGLLEQRGVVVGSGQVLWVGPGLGAAAGLLGVLLYGVLGWLMGQDGFASIDYLVLTLLEVVVAASLMMPILWSVRWALGTEGGARRQRRRQAAW